MSYIISQYDTSHYGGPGACVTMSNGDPNYYTIAGLAESLPNCSITDVKLYLYRNTANTVGNATLDLKACSGTPGTNGIPTGGVLATSSTTLDVSTLGTDSINPTLVTFTFSTPYDHLGGNVCISIYFSSHTANPQDNLRVCYGNSTPYDSGDAYKYDTYNGWVILAIGDHYQLIYYIMASGTPTGTFVRGIKSKEAAGFDYGLRPYSSAADNYPAYSGEITRQYVGNLGYVYRDADYKQPYLHKDYHSMMYLFTTPETQITGQAYGGNRLMYGGDLPRVDDQYFDNSPQVASLTNFNSYARQNYLEMGKGFPTVAQQATAQAAQPTEKPTYKPTTEYIVVSPSTLYGPGTYDVHFNQTRSLSVGNYVYAPSNYTWVFSTWTPYYAVSKFVIHYYSYSIGTLNPLAGYTSTYTAIGGWQSGWGDPAVYFGIELYLGSNLVDNISFRLSA